MGSSDTSVSNPSNSLGSQQSAVLIVDDDPAYVHLLTRYLREAFDQFFIDFCGTSRDALKKCMNRKYKILLVDFQLPDMSGPQFLHKLQSMIDDIAPPAIVLTAEGGTMAAAEALRANAYDFLPKSQVSVQSIERSISNAIVKHDLRISVQNRTRELEGANRSLEEKSREIQEFYQTVSHEVKTPLSASREFVSLVRDGVLGEVSPEQVEVLDYALAGCDQIASHFNDLIEMTRLDTEIIKLHKKRTTIKSMLKRATASYSRKISEKNIFLDLETENDHNLLDVDPERINQVITNLLSNAVKYTPQYGNIKIFFRLGDNAACFGIQDSGCGIDKSEHELIFKRLYQASGKQEDYTGPGLGLGLSIAREIVSLHQGKLWVESKKNHGSCFYFELPYYPGGTSKK
jgi:signal transduction histidine kinase